MQTKEKPSYATLQELPNVFQGTSEKQLRSYVDKMKLDDEYSNGVVNPTKRTTIVDINQFVQFMKKMERERFK